LTVRTISFLLIVRRSVVRENLVGAFSSFGHSIISHKGSRWASVPRLPFATWTRQKAKRERSFPRGPARVPSR